MAAAEVAVRRMEAALTAPFDKQEQYDKVASGVLPNEEILAVYDCTGAGTGFVGITNKRVIIQDHSFVGKRTAVTSIPYSRIHAVGMVTNKSMMGSFFSSGEIAIEVSGKTYEATFRGTDKAAHVHNVILHYLDHSVTGFQPAAESIGLGSTSGQ